MNKIYNRTLAFLLVTTIVGLADILLIVRRDPGTRLRTATIILVLSVLLVLLLIGLIASGRKTPK